MGRKTMISTRRVLGHSLIRSLIRLFHIDRFACVICYAHSFTCALPCLFTCSQSHAKEVYVYDLNASISNGFNPQCDVLPLSKPFSPVSSPFSLAVLMSLSSHCHHSLKRICLLEKVFVSFRLFAILNIVHLNSRATPLSQKSSILASFYPFLDFFITLCFPRWTAVLRLVLISRNATLLF